jgi:hypothetical protein
MFSYNQTGVQKILSEFALHIGVNLYCKEIKKGPYNPSFSYSTTHELFTSRNGNPTD